MILIESFMNIDGVRQSQWINRIFFLDAHEPSLPEQLTHSPTVANSLRENLEK